MNGKRAATVLAVLLCVMMTISAFAELTTKETTKNGKPLEVTWVDEDGNTATGPDGYATVKYQYSRDSVTETYFDTEGAPVAVNGGYFGKTVIRDGRKRITEIIYLDRNGRIAMNDERYARMTIHYTSFDAVSKLSYFGIDKKRTLVPSLGYAAMECDYRGKTLTKRSYLDASGQLTDTTMGYAVMIQKVNKKNQVTGISYEHADGRPATCLDGWSSCEIELDKKGRILSTKYYTEDGRLTDRGAGYAWEQTVYNENEERVTRYDLKGNPVTRDEGYTTLVRVRKNDLIVKEYFLDENGAKTENADGAGALVYEYDDDGNITNIEEEPLGSK